MVYKKKIDGKSLDEFQRAYINGKFDYSDRVYVGGVEYRFNKPDDEILFLNQKLQQVKSKRILYVSTVFQLTKHQKWKVFSKHLLI